MHGLMFTILNKAPILLPGADSKLSADVNFIVTSVYDDFDVVANVL